MHNLPNFVILLISKAYFLLDYVLLSFIQKQRLFTKFTYIKRLLDLFQYKHRDRMSFEKSCIYYTCAQHINQTYGVVKNILFTICMESCSLRQKKIYKQISFLLMWTFEINDRYLDKHFLHNGFFFHWNDKTNAITFVNSNIKWNKFGQNWNKGVWINK